MIEQLPKSTINWYTINTRPKFEEKVQQHIVKQHYISYHKLISIIKQLSNRKKKIRTTLISFFVLFKINDVDFENVVLKNNNN